MSDEATLIEWSTDPVMMTRIAVQGIGLLVWCEAEGVWHSEDGRAFKVTLDDVLDISELRRVA